MIDIRRPILATAPTIAPSAADCTINIQPLGCFHDHNPEPLATKLEDFLTQGSAHRRPTCRDAAE
ncbi:MAG: hypothetical protein ABGW98_07500, partial [Myxococcales bacterium]